ncbi:hypothetical protein Lal_00033573 [Lupinus albus]|nr:hypothetical protein Lal_00033573 [Lupinus albus]
MKVLLGGPGTKSGLLLRLGQCAFGASSIGLMITSFGFSVLWSFGLACLDIYALRRKRELQNPILVSLFVVTATLSLAAACSSAGIVVLYASDLNFCSIHKTLPCNRYKVSVAMAFITWIFTAMSSHVMIWILASV